ncbi:MAG: aldehyde ferredoxin oxidoreductase, partial [Firmicutes bacterium]|nr:aldehyde ferredoxin oxidoreductase [Bacillota bacterium]
MYGNTGRILRVNLTTKQTSVETPDEVFYRRYGGGRNIGAYYLLKEVAPGCDPLGPGNKLIFATSVLTGTGLPGCSRYSVVAK